MVADIDVGAAEATSGSIAANGGSAMALRVDVRSVDDLIAMFEAAVEHFGKVDIVCNNAGIVCGEPLWPETGLDRLADQVAINLGAVILGTRLAVDRFGPEGGVVVNTASIGALLPLEDEPGYSATKAGVVMFTRACAGLARSRHVRVNAVLPGLVETPLLAKSGDGTTEAAWARQARELLPVLSPDDVAAAVVEMVGDDSLAGHCRIVGDLPDFVTDLLRSSPPAAMD